MGAFLAAATGAPVMTIVMIFEMKLNYQILIPVVLADLTVCYICSTVTSRSLNADALARKGAYVVARQLAATLGQIDLIKDDRNLLNSAPVRDHRRQFLQSRHDFLNLEQNNRYIGAIALQNIRPYLYQRISNPFSPPRTSSVKTIRPSAAPLLSPKP